MRLHKSVHDLLAWHFAAIEHLQDALAVDQGVPVGDIRGWLQRRTPPGYDDPIYRRLVREVILSEPRLAPMENGQVRRRADGRPRRRSGPPSRSARYHDEWLDRMRRGETFREIGKATGFSHELVRKWIHANYGEEWKANRASWREEITRLREFWKLQQRVNEARPCVVCRCWVLRGRWRTCSPGCAAVYRRAKIHVDPAAYQRHRELLGRGDQPPNRRYQSPQTRELLERAGRGDLVIPPSPTSRRFRVGPREIVCDGCGILFVHVNTGQRPRWCPDCRPRRKRADLAMIATGC